MNGLEMWEGLLNEPDQVKRMASAKKAECTPLSIDKDSCSGRFSGSHGEHSTTLDGCTCIDYARRKLPCKHMYRLAIELGAIIGEAESDASKVKRKAPAVVSLRDAVRAAESVSESSQRLLRRIMYETLYHKAAVVKLKNKENSEELVSAGLCLRVDEPAGVALVPELEKARRKLYTYLGRRNESEPYFDPESGNIKEIPKGSSFDAIVSLDGGVSLSLCFPDDDVTALLDEYGVNRCRGWTP